MRGLDDNCDNVAVWLARSQVLTRMQNYASSGREEPRLMSCIVLTTLHFDLMLMTMDGSKMTAVKSTVKK